MTTQPVACMDCDAETTLTSDPEHPNLIYMTVAHDDTCPSYRRMQEKRGKG
jgi:hypothetical protein